MWILTLWSAVAAAEPTVSSSRSPSLFAPVPQDALRPLTTDRPDITESAVTVDAGHLQLEMDFPVVGVDRETRDVGLTLMGMNLKLGLTRSVDLQLVAPPIGVPLGADVVRPVGQDALVRVKINVLGNDGGDVALGVMPFVVANLDGLDPDVVIPLEGGVIVPWSFALPADFSLAMMAQFEINHAGAGWQPGGVGSMSVAHPLPIEGVGAYLETAALVAPTMAESALLASGGFTWGATDDVQFDLGARLPVAGVGGAYEGFGGVSIRR
jgi:hypothetical protein